MKTRLHRCYCGNYSFMTESRRATPNTETTGVKPAAVPFDAVLFDPQHEYTRTLLAAVPKIPTEWDARRRGLRDIDAADSEALA